MSFFLTPRGHKRSTRKRTRVPGITNLDAVGSRSQTRPNELYYCLASPVAGNAKAWLAPVREPQKRTQPLSRPGGPARQTVQPSPEGLGIDGSHDPERRRCGTFCSCYDSEGT